MITPLMDIEESTLVEALDRLSTAVKMTLGRVLVCAAASPVYATSRSLRCTQSRLPAADELKWATSEIGLAQARPDPVERAAESAQARPAPKLHGQTGIAAVVELFATAPSTNSEESSTPPGTRGPHTNAALQTELQPDILTKVHDIGRLLRSS